MNKEGYKPKAKSAFIGFRVNPEIDEFLADLSFKSECTKSEVVRSMIEHCKSLAARGNLNMEAK